MLSQTLPGRRNCVASPAGCGVSYNTGSTGMKLDFFFLPRSGFGIFLVALYVLVPLAMLFIGNVLLLKGSKMHDSLEESCDFLIG